MLNVMAIHVQCHTNVSKQTLLDGIDVGLPKWCVCGHGLNQSVHEGMKDISNVKVHLKTCSGNVNITKSDEIQWSKYTESVWVE